MSCIGQLSCACKIVAETLDHVVKYLLSSGADINLRDDDGQSPLFVASQKGHCDVVKCLLSAGAYINLRNENGQSPLFVASSSGYYDIVILLTAHGALLDENVKTISKGTKDDKFPAYRTTLLYPRGYPEEEISRSTEKQEEEKEATCVPKVQEEKEERIPTREKEETEEIISIGETKEEKDKTTEGRKENKK